MIPKSFFSGKKILFFATFFAIFGGGIFVFSAENIPENLQKTKNPIVDCPDFSSDFYQKNEYLTAAKKDGKYFFERAVDRFSKKENAAFSRYISGFSGASLSCRLTNFSDPVFENEKKISPKTFAAEQFSEFSKFRCAMFFIRERGGLLTPENFQNFPNTEIDRRAIDAAEKRKMAAAERDLRDALSVALDEISEIALAYPIHRRLECAHEKMATQRRKLIDFLKIYAAVSASIVNISAK